MSLLYGEEIDQRLNWPLGRAERLARQRRLPYVMLPDGSIRFKWEEIEPLVLRSPRRRNKKRVPDEDNPPHPCP